jgi:hypothetical protein
MSPIDRVEMTVNSVLLTRKDGDEASGSVVGFGPRWERGGCIRVQLRVRGRAVWFDLTSGRQVAHLLEPRNPWRVHPQAVAALRAQGNRTGKVRG